MDEDSNQTGSPMERWNMMHQQRPVTLSPSFARIARMSDLMLGLDGDVNEEVSG